MNTIQSNTLITEYSPLITLQILKANALINSIRDKRAKCKGHLSKGKQENEKALRMQHNAFGFHYG